MHWELEELEKALYAGDIQLAKRYVSKLKAFLFCPKCKEKINWQLVPRESEPYFKGYIHTECADKIWEKKELPGMHPDFGRWIDGEISEEQYADSLADRVDKFRKG